MLTAVWTILIFCTLIFIHELGHFIAAKSVGVTVHEFSIGMGPKLFSRTKGETAYSVRLLPLGGFVRLEGEDDDSESDGALCNKKPWQKFVVLFAGGFMNFVLGFLVFIFLAACKSNDLCCYVCAKLLLACAVLNDNICVKLVILKSNKLQWYNIGSLMQ